MDLYIMSKRDDIGIQVPNLGLLLNLLEEPVNSESVVPLELTIGLQVLRCS